jgi:hypothetical protein
MFDGIAPETVLCGNYNRLIIGNGSPKGFVKRNFWSQTKLISAKVKSKHLRTRVFKDV